MRSKKNRILLYCATVLFWFALYVHMPYLTPYLSAMGLTSLATGVVVGAYGLMQILLRCPLGIHCDRRGSCRPAMLLGCILTAAAGTLRVLVPSSTGFLLANLLGGGAAAMWICFIVFASSLYAPEERQKSSGTVVMLNNLGILAGFLAGAATYDRFGMGLLCRLSIVSGTLAAILVCCLKEEVPTDKSLPGDDEIRGVYRDRNLIHYALLALVLQGIQASTANSFTSQVASSLGANGLQIGLCSTIYITCAVITAKFGSSRAAGKIPARIAIPAGLLLPVAYCVLVPLAPSVGVLYIAQLLIGTAMGYIFSLVMSEAMRNVAPNVRTTAMGLFQATLAVGITFCPLILGMVKGHWGMTAAYGTLGMLAFAAFLFSLYLSGKRSAVQHQ